jgi:hypothetical protein
VVPPLPTKAIKRQMPFRNDDGIYEESFIEERRSGLEAFVNKYVHEALGAWSLTPPPPKKKKKLFCPDKNC